MTEPAPPRAAVWWRLLLLAAFVLALVALVQRAGVGELVSLEGLSRLRQRVEGLGALGPVAFIAGYVLAVVSFVPGLPMT